MAGAPILEVIDVSRSFASRRALRGVSLSIQPGELVALLGPNGAGKTTLVRTICGRTLPDSGQIRVGGGNPRDASEVRRKIGLVPQEIALYSDLTVRENLEVLGRLAGLERGSIGTGVSMALRWIGLEDRAGDRVDSLSGGMRRRINLAAGTLHQPALLLLDEPTVGVDPAARDVVPEALRGLRETGMAILLTTHDLDQAAELADRVVILSEGRVRADGKLEDLLEQRFGSMAEVRVELREVPDEPSIQLLVAAGLKSASQGSRNWSGPLAGGLGSLAGFSSQLETAGIDVDELQVREPNLRSLFFALTGQDLTP